MLIFQLLWTRVSHRTSASPWQEMLVMCLKSCPSAYEGKQTTVLSAAPNHQHILFFWVCPTQQCAGLLWPQPMAQSEIIINNNSSASSKKCQTVALWFLTPLNHSTTKPQHSYHMVCPSGPALVWAARGRWGKEFDIVLCLAVAITSMCDHSFAHELSVMSGKREVRETSWI